jgi:hypothetical protein
VTTLTLAPARPDEPAPARRRVPLDQLTAAQRTALDRILTALGTSGGLVEDAPPVPMQALEGRRHLSDLGAWIAGISLTPGHEITQCNTCLDIVDAAQTTEDRQVIRCTDDCRPAWLASLHEH